MQTRRRRHRYKLDAHAQRIDVLENRSKHHMKSNEKVYNDDD